MHVDEGQARLVISSPEKALLKEKKENQDIIMKIRDLQKILLLSPIPI